MVEVTLIPGDGIGPEISEAVRTILERAGADISWRVIRATPAEQDRDRVVEKIVASIRETKWALQGPITTPVGGGCSSVTVALRQKLGLHVNLRPAVALPGLDCPCPNLDLTVIRENTEGLYSGVEYRYKDELSQSLRVITRDATERVGRFALDYVRDHGYKKLIIVHKGNVLQQTDGMFLDPEFSDSHLKR